MKIYRRMCPVSTKLYRRPPFGLGTTTAPPGPPTTPTLTCFSRNRSDCNRVLTTSNGLVIIAPHIPPTLYSLIGISDGITEKMEHELTLPLRNVAMISRVESQASILPGEEYPTSAVSSDLSASRQARRKNTNSKMKSGFTVKRKITNFRLITCDVS